MLRVFPTAHHDQLFLQGRSINEGEKIIYINFNGMDLVFECC